MKRLAIVRIALICMGLGSMWSCELKQSSEEAQVPELVIDTLNLNQARIYLENSGFYSRPTGDNRQYNLSALKSEQPGYIVALMNAYQPEGDRAMLFYLKMAGASLSDSLARNRFIKYWIANDDQYSEEVAMAVQFVGRKADGSSLDLAVQNILRQLSADQTRYLLLQQRIFLPREGETEEYIIAENKAQLWPVLYSQICADNIKQESMSASDEMWVELVDKMVKQRQN